MPTFGFSAFLKLLSLNDRPQRSELRKRLVPSSGGYDFHRSFRLHANRLLMGGETLADLLRSAENIRKPEERRSVRAALENLRDWVSERPGQIFAYPAVTFESPAGSFKVSFRPDFGLEIDGLRTAVHVWNTKRPDLSSRMVYAALSLLPPLYGSDAEAPDDFAVLSLREPRLYRLSDVEDQSLLAAHQVRAIERGLEAVREELRLPPTTPEERPNL